MIQGKNTGRYRLGLNKLFVQKAIAFKHFEWVFILM